MIFPSKLAASLTFMNMFQVALITLIIHIIAVEDLREVPRCGGNRNDGTVTHMLFPTLMIFRRLQYFSHISCMDVPEDVI